MTERALLQSFIRRLSIWTIALWFVAGCAADPGAGTRRLEQPVLVDLSLGNETLLSLLAMLVEARILAAIVRTSCRSAVNSFSF